MWGGLIRCNRPKTLPPPFPIGIIQHAVWLYHHFPLSYRDVQELLLQRGIEVSHETLCEWRIKFDTAGLLGMLRRTAVRCG